MFKKSLSLIVDANKNLLRVQQRGTRIQARQTRCNVTQWYLLLKNWHLVGLA